MDRRAHGFFFASLGAHALAVLCMSAPCPHPRDEEMVADLVSEITLPVSVVTRAEPPGSPPAAAPVTPVATESRPARERREDTPEAARDPVTVVPEQVTVATPSPEAAPATSGDVATAPASSASPSQGEGTAAHAGRAGEGNGTGAAPIDDTNAVRAFVAALRARVQTARRYPRTALERGLEGDITVTLEIARDGSVRITAVSAPGVPEILITAATDAVRDAGRFPIPASITRDIVRARLPIRFHVSE